MYLEILKNENTTDLNLWDAAKAVIRKKFIALNSDIRKVERPQIKDQNIHLKK